MTLNLNVAKLAGPGRARTALEVMSVRDLGEADLALLAAGDRGTTAPPLKRITDRHHSLARLIAGGASDGEAAATIGFSLSRVSILKQSPAFQDLLALYRKEVDREFATVLEHMAGMSRDALLELRERLEDEPDRFSNRELLDTVNTFVDRADVGEGTRKLPVQINLVPQPVISPESVIQHHGAASSSNPLETPPSLSLETKLQKPETEVGAPN
jgi:hypothetical protein